METKSHKAVERHKKGYNCAQAVVCTYCEKLGVDEKTAFRTAEGFGGGMGQMKETCGALTGLFMLLGYKNSSANMEKPDSKLQTYALVKEAAQKFKDKNTSIKCADLLGVNGAPKLRSCDGCIEDACAIFEEISER